MEFFSFGAKRPVRLSEATRRFAYESLNDHKYGLDTKKVMAVDMDDVPGFNDLPWLDRYDLAIRRIAEQARIRICEGERVSGAATLGTAITHHVPYHYQGHAEMWSVSHLTADFFSAVFEGTDGIRARVNASLEKYTDPEKRRFLESCLSCLDSMQIYHDRLVAALKTKGGYEANIRNLERVPMRPARNFYEAVQSLWFTFAFLRLCGNWPGIGRIDVILGDFLKKDLASGVLTLDEAREILAHFFIKGCEWVAGGDYGSGDAQHYQNIVLSGIDENGNDVTNEVTYLVLDIIEETGISDFPVTIRLNKNTDEKLLRRAAEVIAHGGGVVAVYNEDLILRALENFGYERSEARQFANDGCWEVQVPGRTYFTYMPFDPLEVLQCRTLKNYENVHFDSFEDLYAAFKADLNVRVHEVHQNVLNYFSVNEKGNAVWRKNVPCTVVSLFEGGCIEKGLSYFEGGPQYNVVSLHVGGGPDLANMLYAIKKLVFDDHKVTFDELMAILKADWEGFEPLRQYARNHYAYYGNDNDECDGILARFLEDFADDCAECDKLSPIRTPAGCSTFGRQLEYAPHRLATANGFHKNAVLAANLSPTPGTDLNGATAIIRSYGKCRLEKQVNGAALDIRLLPSAVKGEDGINAIMGLMRGFLAVDGFFMQPDVADAETLREAQAHPENFQTLSVRVSGWNARFVTLNKEWQEMVINEISGGTV